MDGLMDSYMLFFLSGFYFLLPLGQVGHVSAADDGDPDLSEAEFLGMGYQNDSGLDYLVTASCGDREIGIRAERVIGLVRIEEEAVRELPEAVRSDANRYISRMALLEDSGEGKQLAYVLDPCSLTPHSE